jgi:tRNA threonylcarbamoyladenosine biosynthesis protein TsaB
LNILTLDTSTTRAAVAVATIGGAVHAVITDRTVRHGRTLIPQIHDMLNQAGLAPADLHLIGVGLGPGSYTGLRIGVAAAKTLAYALKIPLVSFDSLEAIARNAPERARRVSVIADAQRGDLYTADFERPGPLEPLVRCLPTHLEPRAQWEKRLAADTLVLGPGLERLQPPLAGVLHLAEPDANHPNGHRLIELARELWSMGSRADLWALEPCYLRRSAAEEQWEKLGR